MIIILESNNNCALYLPKEITKSEMYKYEIDCRIFKISNGGHLLIVIIVVRHVVEKVIGSRDALVRMRAAEALEAGHLRGQRVRRLRVRPVRRERRMRHARRRHGPRAPRRAARPVPAVARRCRSSLPQRQVHQRSHAAALCGKVYWQCGRVGMRSLVS